MEPVGCANRMGRPATEEGQPLSTSRGDEQGRGEEEPAKPVTRKPGTGQQPIKIDEGKSPP